MACIENCGQWLVVWALDRKMPQLLDHSKWWMKRKRIMQNTAEWYSRLIRYHLLQNHIKALSHTHACTHACRKWKWTVVFVWGPYAPFRRQPDLGLSVTSFTEAEELEDDSVGPSGEEPHAGLQLLVAPLEHTVHRPQVLDGWHVQEIVLGQSCVKSLEFI